MEWFPDFEYSVNKEWRRYGWSIARYCTPEDFFGEERLQVARTPSESYERIVSHLQEILPWASEDAIRQLV